MNVIVAGGRIQRHEVFQFNHHPEDQAFVEAMMQYYQDLARRAALTETGKSESKLSLKMKLTVDGAEYLSDDLASLYDGIYAMEYAESVLADLYVEGVEQGFCIHEITEKDGGVKDFICLDDMQYVESIIGGAVGKEQFDYAAIEYYANSGEYSVTKIKNGEHVDYCSDLREQFPDKDDKGWECMSLMIGVPAEKISEEAKNRIREVILRYIDETDTDHTEDFWAESEEEDYYLWPIFCHIQWGDDLNRMQSLLDEINAILAEYAIDSAEVEEKMKSLYNIRTLGYAEIKAEKDGFRLVGTKLI